MLILERAYPDVAPEESGSVGTIANVKEMALSCTMSLVAVGVVNSFTCDARTGHFGARSEWERAWYHTCEAKLRGRSRSLICVEYEC